MPNTTTPVAIVDAYHRAWTDGDVDEALTYLSDTVVCSAPDPEITTKAHWREYLAAFVPMLTGAPELTRMAEGDRVTEIRLAFDRLGYMPAPPE